MKVAEYNQMVDHPLQSWEWGEFKKKTGVKVIRQPWWQLMIHSLPLVNYTVGYLPRGPKPDEKMVKNLQRIGRKFHCLFIKLEPQVKFEKRLISQWESLGLRPSPHSIFPQYTFQIDLTLSEKELLKKMKAKTRYNVRLAKRKGVKVSEDNSDQAFATYLRLLKETTKRQGFYAHTLDYHRKMWQVLKPAGLAHLLKAEYRGEILAIWILFRFHQTLYYPYGASSTGHRNLMASNLMMWEAIRWGKKKGCQVFDLWGSLGPKPDKSHPWYGFHRFKEGYGGELVEFIGTYDLIINPYLYPFYNLANNLRWKLLRLKARISH